MTMIRRKSLICFKVTKVHPVRVVREIRTVTVKRNNLCPCGNILSNPGFETALEPAWTTGGTGTVERSDQGQNVHTGGFGVTLTAGATLNQTINIKACCCYELMFWAKGSSGNTNLTASVFLGTSGTPVATITINNGSMDPNSWTSYRTFTPCIPFGTTAATVKFVAGGEGGDKISVDDVILASAGACR